nr:LuxR C-terminal-related transcriptional regulator [uncultured Amphritea sp.]
MQARSVQKITIIGNYPLYRLTVKDLINELCINNTDIREFPIDNKLTNHISDTDIAIIFSTPECPFIRQIINSDIPDSLTIILLSPKRFPNLKTRSPDRVRLLPTAISLQHAKQYLHSLLIKKDIEICRSIENSHLTQEKFLKDISGLTSREIQVFHLISEGLDSQEISAKLSIADKTVKVFLNNIFKKLGISNKAHAASICFSHQYASY